MTRITDSAALSALRDLLASDDDLDDAVTVEPRASVEPAEVEVILHRRAERIAAARELVEGACRG